MNEATTNRNLEHRCCGILFWVLPVVHVELCDFFFKLDLVSPLVSGQMILIPKISPFLEGLPILKRDYPLARQKSPPDRF